MPAPSDSPEAKVERYGLWDHNVPVPTSKDAPLLENVRVSIIKLREPEKDGYDRLRGVAIYRYKGTLFTLGGKVEASPQGCAADYNCLAPGTSLGKPLPGDTHGEHSFIAEPGVASPDRFDFRLRPGSPCTDAGLSIGQAFRGSAPDVGLYEGR